MLLSAASPQMRRQRSLRGIHHSPLLLSMRQSSALMQSCGANSKPVTLLVTDACESCAPNQLNLHALAFQDNFNSDLSVGRVNVSFQQCTSPGAE